jgi:O-antigen ligase
VHVLYIDYMGIAGLWRSGELARPQLELANGVETTAYVTGLTTGPDNDSYLTNMLLGILVAEALFRGVKKLRHLPVGNIVLAGMICVTLFSAYLEARRNGLIGLIFLVAFAALYWLVERKRELPRKTVALAVVLALALTSLVVYVGFKTDPRWRGLQETIPLAWDTENHRAWLDSARYPLPLLSNSEPVADSNYKRIAFLKEGGKLVLEHPFGLGYGRNAFRHGIIREYGAAKLAHSHSGYLDLAIGVGIPGVLLWLAFMGSLLRLAHRRYTANPNMFALLLFILVVDFNLRMLVDSINRDHSLQQFLFLAGLYAWMAYAQPRDAA